MSQIDWSKAGKRLRHQPRRGAHNPDWNWTAQRWKDEADYYADEIGKPEIIALATCPICHAPAGVECPSGIAGLAFHQPRMRAAGLELLRHNGPRFGGDDYATSALR
jgi:hypothetical protein